MNKKKILVALSGASGAGYAIHFLKELSKQKNVEIELIVSDYAERIIELEEADENEKNKSKNSVEKKEKNSKLAEIKKFASKVYDNEDLAAAPSSSSYLVDSMVVIPCSIKTASEIANANCSTLISRAADNMLKMRKQLIVCVRETPMSTPVLKNLYELSLYGAIVFPLSPGFYHKPKDLNELKLFITGKLFDLMGIENELFKRWGK